MPRRIWRIINPLLIFLGITLGVGVIFGIALGVSIALRGALGNGSMDVAEMTNELQRIAIEYAMQIMITGNLVALAAFIPMWIRARRRLEPIKNPKPFGNYILIVAMFAMFNVVLVSLFAILDSLVDLMSFFPSYEGISDILGGGSFVMQLLALGVGAPIVEEICFRGILMERMRWLPVWASVLIQAALFGVAHMNLFQSAYAFVLGIMLGLCYAKFRSIIMVIVAHAVFNITSVIQSWIPPLIPEALFMEVTIVHILAPSFIITAICAVWLIKRPKARAKLAAQEADESDDAYWQEW